MTAIEPLRPRLAKLIPRLASDQDGEVIATVRAIARVLQTAGLDFHDLAQAVSGAPAPWQAASSWSHAARPPPPPPPPPPEPEPDEHELSRMARMIWMQHKLTGATLRERELGFVSDMVERFAREAMIRGGWRPSEKQAAWLRDLHARVTAEARRRAGGHG